MTEQLDLERLLRSHYREVADVAPREGDLDRVLERTARAGQRGATWARVRLDWSDALAPDPRSAVALLLLAGAVGLLLAAALLAGGHRPEVEVPGPSAVVPSATALAVPGPIASLAASSPTPSSTPSRSADPSTPPPEGELLVLQRRFDACSWAVVRTSDAIRRQLPPSGCSAIWSPDGSQIAAWTPSGAGAGYDGEVAILSRDGRIRRRFTAPAGVALAPVAWSPDGALLVFLASEQGRAGMLFTGRATDGGDLRQVTTGTVRALAFSPAGRHLLVVRSLDNGEEVGIVDLADGGYRALASVPTGLGSELRPAAWSPDGARVAVAAVSRTDTDPGLIPSRIEVFAASGGDPVVVAIADGVRDVDWSPDGRLIAYDADARAGRFVYTVAAAYRECACAGTPVVDEAGRPVEGFDPRWSPDGDWLAFQGRDGVEVIRSDGTGRRTVLPAAVPVGMPVGGLMPTAGLAWRP